MRVFYFGCWGELPAPEGARSWELAGHFYWLPGGERAEGGEPRPEEISPWGWAIDEVSMYPIVPEDGHARLHHQRGWTALCFHDRSGDSRPHAHSAFVIEGTHDLEEAKGIAWENFPEIMGRIKFEIKAV